MAEENIVGNYYDKYGTKNPIARKLMSGFLEAAVGLFREVNPTTVLEVGCGEGRLTQHLLENATRRPERFEACDLELDRLAPGLDPLIEFKTASVYELPYADNEFELVVCCEVLEHLEDPARALSELRRVASRAVIISTPREPIWRVMNMLRGKYLGDLGNTPGHIQHFSGTELLALVGRHFEIRQIKRPIPWTMLLAELS